MRAVNFGYSEHILNKKLCSQDHRGHAYFNVTFIRNCDIKNNYDFYIQEAEFTVYAVQY